jgi:hypothetical protein
MNLSDRAGLTCQAANHRRCRVFRACELSIDTLQTVSTIAWPRNVSFSSVCSFRLGGNNSYAGSISSAIPESAFEPVSDC